jgi:hypothetical protein
MTPLGPPLSLVFTPLLVGSPLLSCNFLCDGACIDLRGGGCGDLGSWLLLSSCSLRDPVLREGRR